MMETRQNKGRPRAKIDWGKVDEYLQAGATGVDIAAHLGIHDETLYDACVRDNKTAFSDYSRQKRASGDVLLKVAQFNLALSGDKSMLIWLGKQRLGQTENSNININTIQAGIYNEDIRLSGDQSEQNDNDGAEEST